MKKSAPYILLMVLIITLLMIRNFQQVRFGKSKNDNKTSADPRDFNRNTTALQYTTHAKCRMDCRNINQAEVVEIMREGKINYRKSDLNDRPCPTYALEGYTNDGQYVRIVYAQCEKVTKVVTTIDLDTDFECHCPGDEKKRN